MSKLYLHKEWGTLDLLAVSLKQVLPCDYAAAVDLTVRRVPLDAVIVGPPGLLIVYALDEDSSAFSSQSAPQQPSAATRAAEGRRPPEARFGPAASALHAFVADEFPSLRPPLHHVILLMGETALPRGHDEHTMVVTLDTLADALSALELLPGGRTLDPEMAALLAEALEQRRLTASQRTEQPFIFRSGGLLGRRRKAWSIREMVRHFDSHPDDGIFHLRNGSVARWLSEQGADHLAELAQEVIRRWETDPRVTLETFLVGTGLVQRPRPVVRPRRIHVGSVLIGEKAQCRLRVRKPRGPGYPLGSVHTSEPWLRVDPQSFRGSLEAVVSVNTGLLTVSPKPWGGVVHIEASGGQTVQVPVRVRVVAQPSSFNRHLLRPLAGALTAGLLGLVVGCALGLEHWATPSWVSQLTDLEVVPSTFWAVAVGMVGALLGWYRGLEQPPAWSTPYATGRWLLRLLAWGTALLLLTLAANLSWVKLGPDPAGGLTTQAVGVAALLVLAAAMVPATIGEVRSGHHPQQEGVLTRGTSRPTRRPLSMGMGVALVVLLVLAAPLGARAWQRGEVDRAWSAARQFASEQWGQLHEGIDGVMQRVDLGIVTEEERGATPSPTHAPTRPPVKESGAP